ncbi:oleandomycin transport system permease protein [Herbihabitans rhizosphaerae]|uniref:Transport permease protein n=1 Tax=Herbihabitans rhizosphaerae TaxID=1872711 RepID=A0A4Q7KWN1_9PSEU|nr:ABC transporter permease [Herbihabitans rhizosphaerae]RZS41184.1 oleandomycin transport system permease protein [Herbihabitans rhizosphaerae]
MTTIALDAPPEVTRHIGPARTMRHGLALAWRGILKIRKNPEQLADVTLMPIIFLLLFAYVFGGAIGGSIESYLPQLVPGLAVMTVMMASMTVGMNLNTDVSKGVFDRFRSMPIARPAPLIGAVLADLVRYLICMTILLVVATIMGFRFGTGFVPVVAGVGLAMLFGLCFCWVAVWLGMLIRSPGAMQGLLGMLSLPLTFGSNVFASSDTMPSWLKAWVDISPVTQVADTLRGLFVGGPVAGPLLGSFAWMAGILVVFFPLAMRAYRKRLS